MHMSTTIRLLQILPLLLTASPLLPVRAFHPTINPLYRKPTTYFFRRAVTIKTKRRHFGQCCCCYSKHDLDSDSDHTPTHHEHPQQQQQQLRIYRIGPETTLQDLLQQQEQHQQALSISTPTRQDETAVIQATWNWCAHFVVPHSLCPWAAASVAAPRNVQFFLVSDIIDEHDDSPLDEQRRREEHFERALYLASQVFQGQLVSLTQEGPNNSMDPHTAIAFCIQMPPQQQHENQQQQENQQQPEGWTFESFLDWFDFAEEELFDNGLARQEDDYYDDEEEDDTTTTTRRLASDLITWAPFHPDWIWGQQEQQPQVDDDNDDDANDPLRLEKQTPYPTVSIVATAVIDQAGESATHKIIQHNQDVLSQKTYAEWRAIYETAVRRGELKEEPS